MIFRCHFHQSGPLGRFRLRCSRDVRVSVCCHAPHAIFVVPGENRGIGTLKKCTNKNVYPYNWHRGAAWHRYSEKMYKQKSTSLQLALGSTVASVPWKNGSLPPILVLLSALVERFGVSRMWDFKSHMSFVPSSDDRNRMNWRLLLKTKTHF